MPKIEFRHSSPAGDHRRPGLPAPGQPRIKVGILDFFALVHNTVRGAAGTCLFNAEPALAERLIPGPGGPKGGGPCGS